MVAVPRQAHLVGAVPHTGRALHPLPGSPASAVGPGPWLSLPQRSASLYAGCRGRGDRVASWFSVSPEL